MNFFNDHAVAFALVCALLAIAWGVGLIYWLLQQPAGNERMQEISRAVQEGAAAYLKKQYTTIAVVAIVPFLLLGFYNQLGWGTAFGFLIGAVLSAAAGLHRHERRGALERAHRRGRPQRAQARAQRRLPRRLGHRPPRRRARAARRRRLLRDPHELVRASRRTARSTTSSGSPSAAR